MPMGIYPRGYANCLIKIILVRRLLLSLVSLSAARSSCTRSSKADNPEANAFCLFCTPSTRSLCPRSSERIQKINHSQWNCAGSRRVDCQTSCCEEAVSSSCLERRKLRRGGWGR
ncbi:hypothetical protein IWX92DRAFT_156234 [Phyllosticta citricarpa]